VSLFAFRTDNCQSSGYKNIKSPMRTPKSENVLLPSERGLSEKPRTIPSLCRVSLGTIFPPPQDAGSSQWVKEGDAVYIFG